MLPGDAYTEQQKREFREQYARNLARQRKPRFGFLAVGFLLAIATVAVPREYQAYTFFLAALFVLGAASIAQRCSGCPACGAYLKPDQRRCCGNCGLDLGISANAERAPLSLMDTQIVLGESSAPAQTDFRVLSPPGGKVLISSVAEEVGNHHVLNVRAEFRRLRRTRRWLIAPFLVSFAILILLSASGQNELADRCAPYLFGVASISLLAAIACSARNWECPACGVALEHAYHFKHCENCGAQF